METWEICHYCTEIDSLQLSIGTKNYLLRFCFRCPPKFAVYPLFVIYQSYKKRLTKDCSLFFRIFNKNWRSMKWNWKPRVRIHWKLLALKSRYAVVTKMFHFPLWLFKRCKNTIFLLLYSTQTAIIILVIIVIVLKEKSLWYFGIFFSFYFLLNC